MGYFGQGGGYGSPGQRVTFQDPGNGPTGGLGVNWAQGVQINVGGVPPVALARLGIAPSAVDGLQCFKVFTFGEGVGNVQSPTYITPLPPIGLLNKSQFVEWKIVRFTKPGPGNNVSGGHSIFIVYGGENTFGSDYRLILDSTAGTATLVRFTGTVQLVISGLGQFSFVDGDVYRLSGTINPNDVTLKVFRNGVLQATFTDATAGRLVTGMPGMALNSFNNASANYIAEFRNFDCGGA